MHCPCHMPAGPEGLLTLPAHRGLRADCRGRGAGGGMRGGTCIRQAGWVTPSPVHTEETAAQRAEWLGPGHAH